MASHHKSHADPNKSKRVTLMPAAYGGNQSSAMERLAAIRRGDGGSASGKRPSVRVEEVSITENVEVEIDIMEGSPGQPQTRKHTDHSSPHPHNAATPHGSASRKRHSTHHGRGHHPGHASEATHDQPNKDVESALLSGSGPPDELARAQMAAMDSPKATEQENAAREAKEKAREARKAEKAREAREEVRQIAALEAQKADQQARQLDAQERETMKQGFTQQTKMMEAKYHMVQEELSREKETVHRLEKQEADVRQLLKRQEAENERLFNEITHLQGERLRSQEKMLSGMLVKWGGQDDKSVIRPAFKEWKNLVRGGADPAELAEELQQLEAVRAELETRCATLQRACTELQDGAKHAKENIDELHKEMKEKASYNEAKLHEAEVRAKEEVASWQEQAQAAQREVQSLRTLIETNQQEYIEARMQQENATRLQLEAMKPIHEEALNQQARALQAHHEHEQSEALNRQQELYEVRLTELRKQIEQQKTENQEQAKRSQQHQNTIKQLQQQIDQQVEQIKAFNKRPPLERIPQGEIMQLQKQLKQTTAERDGRVQELVSQAQTLRGRVKNLEEERQHLQEFGSHPALSGLVDQLEREAQERRKALDRVAKAEMDLHVCRAELEDKEEEVDALARQKQADSQMVEKLKRQVKSMREVMEGVDISLEKVQNADGTIDPARLVLELASSVLPLVDVPNNPYVALDHIRRAVATRNPPLLPRYSGVKGIELHDSQDMPSMYMRSLPGDAYVATPPGGNTPIFSPPGSPSSIMYPPTSPSRPMSPPLQPPGAIPHIAGLRKTGSMPVLSQRSVPALASPMGNRPPLTPFGTGIEHTPDLSPYERPLLPNQFNSMKIRAANENVRAGPPPGPLNVTGPLLGPPPPLPGPLGAPPLHGRPGSPPRDFRANLTQMAQPPGWPGPPLSAPGPPNFATPGPPDFAMGFAAMPPGTMPGLAKPTLAMPELYPNGGGYPESRAVEPVPDLPNE